ncbi:EAL domain-containing protein [Alkalinema sp. FACHB-956]|uniref:sensor domain-containing protein n=1 Tax=Alkalinema sp. FACHB-956 TaxID=2692768 RepID=UPI0016898E4D|nr:EAL domain-containing protein [Alkalinema sp. FACHB-956]MBD2327360.1 EAL domain-containing protein [Alkalinema sp. FACHB-956]
MATERWRSHSETLGLPVKSENDWLLKTVLENLNDGIIVTDLDNQILHVNSRIAKLVGFSPADMVGQSAQKFLSMIEGWLYFCNTPDQVTANRCEWKEGQLRRKDGRQFWAEVNSTLLYDSSGKTIGNLITVTDITERKWLEEYLRLLESVVVNANEIVMITQFEAEEDPLDLRIVYVNEAFLKVTGHRAAEVIGKTPLILMGPETDWDEVNRVRSAMMQFESVKAELLLHCKDRSSFWADSNTVPIRNEHGQVTHFVSVMREVTERKEAENQLRRNAFHDSLTGLPNRLMFMERLAQVVARRDADPAYLFAVLFLDLDRFKVINDSLGHIVGDQLLIEIARRLESCVKKTDLVARLGGDEFTILLDNIQGVESAHHVAERIHQELGRSFLLNGHEVFTTVSIGIALSTTAFDHTEDLLRGADIAMYRAKALGKACHEVFDTEMHGHVMALMQLENDLRRAIEREEFQVYYQPIVSLTTGRVTGFEALIRWQHPDRGLISPAQFIPLAEETGLIIPMGRWVLREACRQLGRWQTQYPHHQPLSVSVNLSSRQFSQAGVIEMINEILEESGLPPACLKLEITETAIMENTASAMDTLSKLKAMGVKLSVDDFGTGYSSLGYLYRFPMDVLKIDRSFISRVDIDGEKLELVRTIITLAWNLGMEVIAEGVETTKQLAQLKMLKCEYGQGYLFSKPMSPQDAEQFLAQENPLEHLAQLFPGDHR